uniref:Growth hormone n=1 Tax=Andrias davidianus TaxID=141262 RepID=B3GQC1_ANDDA|nr:growth hormone precursor [Andrias davidianus]
MAPGLCFYPVLLAVIAISQQPHREVSAFPTIPLANLFNNAVIRAQRLHILAADIYKQFERSYIPDEQRHTNRNFQSAFCSSETIPAPTGKDDAQQRSDMELLRFSLALIRAWLTPSQHLSSAFTNSLDVLTSAYRKLKDLEEGVETLIRDLGDGSSRAFLPPMLTYDNFDANQRDEDALFINYGLLSCFKKDMHKVETYLKVMKCRRILENNCTV